METPMLKGVSVRFLVKFILTCAVAVGGRPCPAQVTKLNTEDLMDTVWDMKKAAATADKLSPDGSKYCHWGTATLDASDLDLAVFRFLLNRGSQVVIDDISASMMWHVSLVADDLINQLEFRLQECNLGMRLNRGSHDIAVASKDVLSKLRDANFKFAGQAYLQTVWQEEGNHAKLLSPNKPDPTNTGTPAVDTTQILGASREVREAWESANKVATEADATRQCLPFGPTDKRIEPVELDKLIERVSSLAPFGSYVPASEMWLVAISANNQKLTTQFTLEACGYYALWKKKAKKVADAASDSDQRLKAAVTKFNALALRQTEWEERVFQNQATIQEQ
jgi:hypothetical protein